MKEDKKLNNLVPGSEEGITKDKTELEKKDEGGEKLLAGKFKSEKELVKAYEELEGAHTKETQETSTLRERLAKLEGVVEGQRKEPERLPQITPEEKKRMQDQFKNDFNQDPLTALHSFIHPYLDDARVAREEAESLRKELQEKEERRGDLVRLSEEARSKDPETFDELKPAIEKELREDKNLARYENPYTAAFYKVVGKSYKKLAKGTDAERESFVEGSSPVPPEGKDKKKDYVKGIVKAKINTRL